MNQKKILFYIDSPGQIAAMAATAKALQKRLNARIILMLIDSKVHYGDSIADFETYDFSVLFRPLDELTPSWIPRSLAKENALYYQEEKKQSPLRRWLIDKRTKIRRSRLRFGVSRRLNKQRIVRSPWVKEKRATLRRQRFIFGLWRRRQLWSLSRLLKDRKKRKALRRWRRGLSAWKPRTNVHLPVNSWVPKYWHDEHSAVGRSRKAVQGFKYWYGATRSIRGFVRIIEPDLIILCEDNIETFTRVFVAYGAERDIPSILLPTTIPNPLEAAQFYESDPGHQLDSLLKRILFSNKWRYKHRDKKMLRLPAHKIMALEALGLSTPAPWILNRGSSAAIALDSEMQRDLYRELGFPSKQLKVVGDMNGNTLYEGLRNKDKRVKHLCEEYGLDPDRPLILCGFPPDQFSSSNTSPFEYSSFGEMMDAWMESFHRLSDHANIIIRPHPRLDPEQLARYSSATLKIVTLPTIELIPLCDLYVASISATIRWAISCGIPVINYDCYRYKYGDFNGAPGVIEVDQQDDFNTMLERFTSNREFAKDLRRKQQSVMNYWGLVDDKCPDRLSELALSVMENTASDL